MQRERKIFYLRDTKLMANLQYSTKVFISRSAVVHRYHYNSCFQRIKEKEMQRMMMMSSGAVNKGASSDASRPLPKYESNLWANHLLSYTSQQTEITVKEKLELERLKEKVRKMLVETADNSTQKLMLIDTIQRLGVAYHFNDEIETSLQNIFDESLNCENEDNLYSVALRFRLVRQQGHHMSSDVFKQFLTKDGKFKESLTNDVQTLLSLYEAAHLRVHDEEILEEALNFTATHLESMVPNMSNNPLKVQVTLAFSHPFHKTIPRFGARKYIDIYENIEARSDLLLKFAKFDFNLLQKQHQRELSELTRWWNGLDTPNKLPYARDKLVDAYIWALGVYFEPQYTRARNMFVKAFKLGSLNDDTYDSYATYDELVLFTDAIQRWDISSMDSLPPYMRPLYQANLDSYNEMERVLAKEGKSDRVNYGKNEMKKLLRSYFKEAEWLNDGYTPTCEEYIKNAFVSSAMMMLTANSLVGLEEFISNDTFELMTSEPSIVLATSAVSRFMDDISDHECQTQHQSGQEPSIIECYMKEFGATKEEACDEFRKEVKNAWKVINKALLRPTQVPMFVLERALNLARLFDTTYQGGDGYSKVSNSKSTDIITMLLVKPVSM